jgi:hypothetical protein
VTKIVAAALERRTKWISVAADAQVGSIEASQPDGEDRRHGMASDVGHVPSDEEIRRITALRLASKRAWMGTETTQISFTI